MKAIVHLANGRKIRLVQSERWRHPALVHRLDAHDSLDAAARAQRVPIHGLGRRHRKLVGVPAERLPDRLGLVAVADDRSRAVRIQIVDVGRLQPGIPEREPHGFAGAVDVAAEDRLAVGRHADAAHLGQHPRSARSGVAD